jgi:hypothetical protein
MQVELLAKRMLQAPMVELWAAPARANHRLQEHDL